MSRLAAIQQAVADFDALHGRGSAVRDFAIGALIGFVLLLDVAVFAAASGAGQ